jgi:hypothetical protein
MMDPTLGRVVIGKEKPKIVSGPQNQKRSRPTELVDSAVPALSPAERKRAKKKLVLEVNVNKAKKYPEWGNRLKKEMGLSFVSRATSSFHSRRRWLLFSIVLVLGAKEAS